MVISGHGGGGHGYGGGVAPGLPPSGVSSTVPNPTSQSAEISHLWQENARLRASREDAARIHEQQLYSAEMTIAAREKELDQLYQHIKQLTDANDAQSGVVRDQIERIQTANGVTLEETRREMETAKTYASNVLSRLNHVQQQLRSSQTALSSLRPQLDAANKHIQSLTADNQRLRDQLMDADGAILKRMPQPEMARTQSADLTEEVKPDRANIASNQSGMAQLKAKLKEADAHIAKLDSELIAVDRTRFEFETECVRLRETLRFSAGGLGQQLSNEIERRQAAEHDLTKLDKYCRFLADQLAAIKAGGKALSGQVIPPNPYHQKAKDMTLSDHIR